MNFPERGPTAEVLKNKGSLIMFNSLRVEKPSVEIRIKGN